MDRDEDVWRFMLKRRDFFRFSEIKGPLQLHDVQLTNSLRRLEKTGRLVKEVGLYKNRPVNTYLAIDPSDPKLRAKVVDSSGWLFTVIEWLDKNNLRSHSVSFDLGELANYIREVDGKPYLEWPLWIKSSRS